MWTVKACQPKLYFLILRPPPNAALFVFKHLPSPGSDRPLLWTIVKTALSVEFEFNEFGLVEFSFRIHYANWLGNDVVWPTRSWCRESRGLETNKQENKQASKFKQIASFPLAFLLLMTAKKGLRVADHTHRDQYQLQCQQDHLRWT